MALAERNAATLQSQIQKRKREMEADDLSHHLIYRVLGVSSREGRVIDEYQNTGRFLYKYAGSFLEEAAVLCLKSAYPSGQKTKIINTLGQRPKTFEIDFLNGNDALELKWRDATTDGDHITKEHTRIKVIKEQGFTPIRVMFFYPQREQSIKIQQNLQTLYAGVQGEYYAGDKAWSYLQHYTRIDLKTILMTIADENATNRE
jgi:hypothetical protein